MKNKTYFTIGLLLLGLWLALLGCRPDKKEDPVPVNPCANAKLPQTIIMVDDGSKKYYPDSTEFFSLDTVLSFYVNFWCTTNYDEYAWTVGTDPKVHRSKSFGLNFDGEYNNLKVQLIGRRKPDPCFPNDDGIDTVVKYITTVNPDRLPILGTYVGYNESEPDKQVEVKIYRAILTIGETPLPFIKGLFRNPIDFTYIDELRSHSIFIPGGINLTLLNGLLLKGRLQSDYRTIIIDYGVKQSDLSYRRERFIGVKQFNRKD
jgi:hypothetical protein